MNTACRLEGSVFESNKLLQKAFLILLHPKLGIAALQQLLTQFLRAVYHMLREKPLA